jgi:hypothetical protein
MKIDTATSPMTDQDWEEMLSAIPKTFLPVEFIKQIVFHYADKDDIVLDMQMLTTDLRETLEMWMDERSGDSEKVSMIVDVNKVRKYIEPITSDFLNAYFK